MSTPNPHALLYGSDHETYNQAVTTTKPSFLTGQARDDYDEGYFDDVRNALSGQPETLQKFNEFMNEKQRPHQQMDAHLRGLDTAADTVGQGKPGTQSITNQPDNRYQMEVCDSKYHRMGDYLKGALEEFRGESLENPNFFRWVESEVKKDATDAAKRWNKDLFKGIKGHPKEGQLTAKYVEWFASGVKYIEDEVQRDRYKVSIDQGVLSRRGPEKSAKIDTFDTEALVIHFKGKKGDKASPVQSCIWVMGANNEFYTHLVKVGRFHHSSLSGGSNIEGAGEWVVKNGKIAEIDGTTGHYKVPEKGFVNAIQRLSAKGALQPDTKVNLYAKQGGAKSQVDATAFAANPSSFLNTHLTYNPLKHGQV